MTTEQFVEFIQWLIILVLMVMVTKGGRRYP